MESVVKEYIWNEAEDVIVYERDGVEKRLTIQPNMILTRMCHLDSDRYLVGELEDKASSVNADPMYERYLEELKGGYVNFAEVLAIGKGRPWTRREQKKYKVAKNWQTPVKIGDMLLMPEQDKWGRLWRYILGKPYLHICESHVPILIVREEDK